MFSSRGNVRYEERGQRYRDVEKVGKHGIKHLSLSIPVPSTVLYPLRY